MTTTTSTTANTPVPGPGILDIEAYVPGESAVPGGLTPVKLSSNETPLGPSPAAIDAVRACASRLERYPDGTARQLREAIASVYDLEAEHIVCGAGSDEILSLLAAAYLGPGDEAIYSAHGFLVYRIAILANGAIPVIAPETGLRTDVDAILDCVTPRTRMAFLANPNNPTGTYAPDAEIRRLRAGLPDNVILVLDGAYAEYVGCDDYNAGAGIVRETHNTVMTRTFSKVYGLAALRIGWGYMPPAIADVINRVRGPFNVSSPAIAAATAAVSDLAHTAAAVRHNDAWLSRLGPDLAGIGIEVTPSVANFVLIHFPDEPGRTAAEADEALRNEAIILRRVGAYGLPNALRMSIGTDAENARVLEVLGSFMRPDQKAGSHKSLGAGA